MCVAILKWDSANNLHACIALPTFLADEKERATTRYVNITTIATFFSSVTATTLQFSLPESGTRLGSVVNFFWFLSLVFSVSAGINSLLGMTWRKSSMWASFLLILCLKTHVNEERYDSYPPPLLVKLWLDKAPMIFLIIAAVMFVIGLNLFVYIPGQPQVRGCALMAEFFDFDIHIVG